MSKIGETHYFSTLALTHPLRSGAVLADLSLVRGGLTELSEALVRGELDAGPISVVEYLKHRSRFERVPNLAVSSWGRAGLGVLFSRHPIGHPEGHTIAVPSRTAGAVTLLRSLMVEMYGVEPRFVEQAGTLDELLDTHGAALLFEDEAMIASHQMARGIEVWDLGDAWWELNHTPLIYMLWVSQASLAEAERTAIHDTLTQAKAAAVAMRPQIIEEATRTLGLPAEVIEAFLSRFNYDFTPAHEAGLGLLAATFGRLEGIKV